MFLLEKEVCSIQMSSFGIFALLLMLCCCCLAHARVKATADCPAPLHSPQDRRVDKTALRFMEWNVEWLFLNSTSATVKCPGDCTWKSEADALLHLKTIASHIRSVSADLIVLTEVQDCSVGHQLLIEIGDPTLRFYLIEGASRPHCSICATHAVSQQLLIPHHHLYSRNRHRHPPKRCAAHAR